MTKEEFTIADLHNENGKHRPRSNWLRVLTYHRVANPENTPLLNPRLISATPETFAAQMRYLAKNYRVVSMEDVLYSIRENKTLPKHTVLITFDDAYCDFDEFAWPVLKRLGLPATLFVPTDYPDHPERSFWWDRLYRAFLFAREIESIASPIGALPLGSPALREQSLRKLQSYLKAISHAASQQLLEETCAGLGYDGITFKSVLSWSELRQLKNEGVTLGAHSRTHPILNRLDAEGIRKEIVGSRDDLCREVGEVLPIFSSPNGGYDSRVINILREEGFEIAFTTADGHNDISTAELLALSRTNITQRTTPLIFHLRLMRPIAYFDKWRHERKKPLARANAESGEKNQWK